MSEEFKLYEEDKEIIEEYRDLKIQEEQIKLKIAEVQPYVYEIMEDFELKNIDMDGIKVTYIDAGVTNRFDSKSFKADHPKLYEQYMKEFERKASIRTKVE